MFVQSKEEVAKEKRGSKIFTDLQLSSAKDQIKLCAVGSRWEVKDKFNNWEEAEVKGIEKYKKGGKLSSSGQPCNTMSHFACF